LPAFFKSEAELRKLWSSPITRKALLEELEQVGFGKEELTMMKVASRYLLPRGIKMEF